MSHGLDSNVILVTKLEIPRWNCEIVIRKRLLSILGETEQLRPLSVICAPAGFGKTTLATSWLTQILHRTTWLSLDENDNESARFLSYFIAGLQKIEASLGRQSLAHLKSAKPQHIQLLLPQLLNDISEYEGNIMYAIDDYHLIENTEIHEFISFLLDHLPENLFLTIISRTKIPFPLSRLRVRGLIAEIHENDLRFSKTECQSFLKQVMHLSLNEASLQLLRERTEGWIAGIQLAALSLQGEKNTEAFLQKFSGDDHFVTKYLTEEVLLKQTTEITHFLLSTSVLSRLNAGLCNAVTSLDNSQNILQTLEQNNMFIIPLDNKRQWFRYHHLFADLLISQLQSKHPDLIADLHRKASDWYASQHLYEEAVRHAFLARDNSKALDLIESCGFKLFPQGKLTTLLSWFATIPDSEVEKRPAALILKAMVTLIGSGKSVTSMLDIHEKLLSKTGQEHPAAKKLMMHNCVLRGFSFLYENNNLQASRHIEKALKDIPEEEVTLRAYCYLNNALANFALGEMKTTELLLQRSLLHSKEHGITLTLVPSVSGLIRFYFLSGDLRKTQQVIDEWIPDLESIVPFDTRLSRVYYVYGDLCRERGETQKSFELYNKGLKLAELDGSQTAQAVGLCLLGYQLCQSGKQEAQVQLNRQFLRLTNCPPMPPISGPLDIYRARWLLARGDDAGFNHWYQEKAFDIDNHYNAYDEKAYLLYAQYLYLKSRHSECIKVLGKIVHETSKNNRLLHLIEARCLQALTQHSMGKETRSIDTLSQVIELIGDNNYCYSFVDFGLPMKQLLTRLYETSLFKTRIARVLNHFPEQEAPRLPKSVLMIKSLSNKEKQTLSLLIAGSSNQEIANQLFVSPNTVKTHIRNIYSKLKVNNRSQAINKAREARLTGYLGLE